MDFSDDTFVENGCDYIYVYDAAGRCVGSFTGDELQGRTVYLPKSNRVIIRLVSDGSVTGDEGDEEGGAGSEWGYAVTEVHVLDSLKLDYATVLLGDDLLGADQYEMFYPGGTGGSVSVWIGDEELRPSGSDAACEVRLYALGDDDESWVERGFDDPLGVSTYKVEITGLADYEGQICYRFFGVSEASDYDDDDDDDWMYLSDYSVNDIVSYSARVLPGVNPLRSVQIGSAVLRAGLDYTLTFYARDSYGDFTAPRGSRPPIIPGDYLAYIEGESDFWGATSFRFLVYVGAPDGAVADVAGSSYKVSSDAAATVVFAKAPKSKKSVTVPASVTISGKSYKVTGIAKNAFKGSKAKAVTVKSASLTKKAVKGCFKGAKKVKTVKVKVGSKKANKKAVKKYKKIFTKKNCGKKVTVK